MTVLVDILLALAFVLTALAGLRNGFFRELFSLVGLVLGVVAGMRFTGDLAEQIGVSFIQTEIGLAILFVALFLAVFALTVLAGGLLAHVWEGKSPGFPSRLMGLGVGALRGFLLVIVLAGALVLLADEGSTTLADSKVLPYLGPGVEAAASVLPNDIGHHLAERWSALPFAPEWMKGGMHI